MTSKKIEQPNICRWTSDYDGIWTTSCKVTDWVFEHGTPRDNNMKFCPFCGKTLRQASFREGRA